MLNHGGKLRAAAKHYQIPLSDWIDLSTGVNPRCYPIPEIPVALWNRLPEDDDGLIEAAMHYYQCPSLLAVAGSQAAIQSLPVIRRQLFPLSKTVAIPATGYREHYHAWQQQGYEVITYRDEPAEQQLRQADVVLVINPNNPTGHRTDPEKLRQWQKKLSTGNGWLVIDEAFIDSTPEYSLSHQAPEPGLIILRSVGKFFGLAGIRLGFVLAEPKLLSALQEMLGPWTVTGPSRLMGQKALRDQQWQHQNREFLVQSGYRLQQLIKQYFARVYGTPMFVTAFTEQAITLHETLCQQGIFTRLLDEKNGLRFGLPEDEAAWCRLEAGLKTLAIA